MQSQTRFQGDIGSRARQAPILRSAAIYEDFSHAPCLSMATVHKEFSKRST